MQLGMSALGQKRTFNRLSLKEKPRDIARGFDAQLSRAPSYHRFHHLIKVEGAGLLTGGNSREGRQPLPDKTLLRGDQEQVLERASARSPCHLGRALERVPCQISQLWAPQLLNGSCQRPGRLASCSRRWSSNGRTARLRRCRRRSSRRIPSAAFAHTFEWASVVAIQMDLKVLVLRRSCPVSKSSVTISGSPAAAISVVIKSWRAPTSLIMVPGWMTPGQLIATRNAVAAFPVRVFSPRNRVFPPSGQEKILRAVVGGVHNDGVVFDARRRPRTGGGLHHLNLSNCDFIRLPRSHICGRSHIADRSLAPPDSQRRCTTISIVPCCPRLEWSHVLVVSPQYQR